MFLVTLVSATQEYAKSRGHTSSTRRDTCIFTGVRRGGCTATYEVRLETGYPQRARAPCESRLTLRSRLEEDTVQMHTQRLESRGEPCMPTDPTTGEATPGGPLRPRAPPRVRTRCTRPADASHLPRSDHGPVSLPERTMSTRPRKTPARDVSRATLRRRWNGTWATREKIAGRSTREDQLSGSMRASSTAPPRHHVSSRAGVIPTTSTSARRGERGPRRRVYRHAVTRGPVVNTTGRDRPRHDETPRRDDTPRRHAETRRDSASRRHAETSRRRVETRRLGAVRHRESRRRASSTTSPHGLPFGQPKKKQLRMRSCFLSLHVT